MKKEFKKLCKKNNINPTKYMVGALIPKSTYCNLKIVVRAVKRVTMNSSNKTHFAKRMIQLNSIYGTGRIFSSPSFIIADDKIPEGCEIGERVSAPYGHKPHKLNYEPPEILKSPDIISICRNHSTPFNHKGEYNE